MSFSLRSCLVALAIAAVGFTAVFGQLYWAVGLMYTITLVMLAMAAVGAIVTRGGTRVYWLGFATLGWTYWLVGFDEPLPTTAQIPMSSLSFASYPYYSGSYVRDDRRLVTSDLLTALEKHLSGSHQVGSEVMAQWGTAYYPARIIQDNDPEFLVAWSDGSQPTWVKGAQITPHLGATRRAGHSLFCLLFGVIGGVLASWMFGADAKHDEKPMPPNAQAAATSESHPLATRKK